MAKSSVPITPSVLRWAIDESGIPVSELAERANVPAAELRAWISGQSQPGKTAFSKLAAALHRPSALFFLPEPPPRDEVQHALRAAPGLFDDYELTEHDALVVRRVRRLQNVLAFVQKEKAATAPTIPRARMRDRPARVAQGFRDEFGPTLEEQVGCNSKDDAFKLFRRSVGRLGVFVLQQQLGEGGLRGFSIWDEAAPIVVVNSGYNFAARSYTLYHELGHLLLRRDSACHAFADPDDASIPAVERWCERFASAFLIPSRELRRLVGAESGRIVSEFEEVDALAAHFNVSLRAMSIRLERLGLAAADLYGLVDSKAEVVDLKLKQRGGRGVKRPQKRLRELGPVVPRLLIEAANDGVVGVKDVSSSLGVNVTEMAELEELVEAEDAKR